jgi:hypothetical protein
MSSGSDELVFKKKLEGGGITDAREHAIQVFEQKENHPEIPFIFAINLAQVGWARALRTHSRDYFPQRREGIEGYNQSGETLR